MEKLEKYLACLEGGKILDIASGRGEFVHLLKSALKNYDEIVGIDSIEKAAEFAKKQFEDDDKISFRTMNAYNLDFEDNCFDTVSLSNSIHHFKEYYKIAKEAIRVLKPNGKFIISEMVCDEDQTNAQKSHVKIHHWSAKIDRILGIAHDDTFTSEELAKIVENFGLENIEKFSFCYPAPESKNEEAINRYLSVVDQLSKRVEGKPESKEITEEGEEIKAWIKDNGFASARILFFVGTKPE